MSIKLGSQTFAERNILGEKNDCTVRAFADAMGIEYMTAYGMMLGFGRKKGKGFRCDSLYARYAEPMPRPSMTVANYVKFIAHTGNWIIEIRGHVFAVRNGEIRDINPSYNLERHVVKAWRMK